MQAQRAISTISNWSTTQKLLIAAVIALGSIAFTYRSEFKVDPATILAFGYLAIFLFPLIGSLIPPIPVTPFIFLAAGIFDPLAITIIAAAGMTVGMTITYYTAASHKQAVQNKIANRTGIIGRLANKTLKAFENKPALTTFAISAIPGPFCAFSGVLAGSAGVPARTYFINTYLGRIITVIPLVIAGKYAASSIQNLGLMPS
jgi:membrane protein DedA with SNARE-associated domain